MRHNQSKTTGNKNNYAWLLYHLFFQWNFMGFLWSNLTQCFWIKTTNNMWVMHDEQKINVSNMEEKSCCGRLFSHIFMFHRDLDSKFSSAQWMYWTLLSLSWKSVGAAHCCQHWDRGMRQQKESTSSALKPSALSATTWHTEEREDALVRMELHQPSR